MLTIAIGDVHGHLALLLDLLRRLERETRGEPHRIVCLGDYIDRGPASAQVVETLRRLQAERGRDRFVCLKGNHEAMLLRARQEPSREQLWLDNGGLECLASYGVASVADIPDDAVAWLADCPTYFEDAWRCYVHAGLNPDRDRLDQSDEDRLWIRERFLLADEHDFGRFVVHGHTPQKAGRPDLRPHRVNLDTAAAYGGPLTAAMFEDGVGQPSGFLQAWPG